MQNLFVTLLALFFLGKKENNTYMEINKQGK